MTKDCVFNELVFDKLAKAQTLFGKVHGKVHQATIDLLEQVCDELLGYVDTDTPSMTAETLINYLKYRVNVFIEIMNPAFKADVSALNAMAEILKHK